MKNFSFKNFYIVYKQSWLFFCFSEKFMVKKIKDVFAYFNTKRVPSSSFNINSSFANRSVMSNSKLYVNNPCVRRSVNVIAQAVSSIKFKVFKDGKYLTKHSLYDLLNQPNSSDCWSAFIEGLVTNFMIHGNAYVALMHNDRLQLHNLRSDKVEIVPGAHGVPKAFHYEVDGKRLTFNNEIEQLPNIGHVKTFNPYDSWYGLSPLEAVNVSANLHQAITTHNLSMINNGGRVSGIVSVKSGANRLTQEQKEAIKQDLVLQYQGPNNAGRIAFVEGGDFSWTPMGASTHDMDYVNAKMLASREISEALGVPSMLIGGTGVSGESSRANFKEIVERFHEGTVLPIAQRIFSFLNNWLVAQIDSACTLQMDLEHFLPLHDKRYELWDKVNAATFLSDAEKRILLGLEHIKDESIVART